MAKGSSPWRVVPPASHRISRVPWYSGTGAHEPDPVVYGTLTLSGGAFQLLPLAGPVDLYSLSLSDSTPALQPQPWRCRHRWFGLIPVRSPLLRDSLLIPSPRGTEMFQFPRFPSVRLCIQRPIRPLARTGVAPFGFDWLNARLQLPSHVSPFSAPFFGLWPHRHPPYTLLRLARYESPHEPRRKKYLYPRSIYSHRQNRSKSSHRTRYVVVYVLAASLGENFGFGRRNNSKK